jgi:hypothetical protein
MIVVTFKLKFIFTNSLLSTLRKNSLVIVPFFLYSHWPCHFLMLSFQLSLYHYFVRYKSCTCIGHGHRLLTLMWRIGWAHNNIPIYIQQVATLHSLFISWNCSTYFGWYFNQSSGAHTTVSTASIYATHSTL